MNGNRELHGSGTSSGVTKTVDYRLQNWVSRKEFQVARSWCDVSLPLSPQGTAQIRYGLKWVTQNPVAGDKRIMKYLALTVEPRHLPSGPLQLNVKMSWNLHETLKNTYPSKFETCVRMEMGSKVTVFDNVLLEDIYYISGHNWNGLYSRSNCAPEAGPQGDDLILCITSTVVSLTSQPLCGLISNPGALVTPVSKGSVVRMRPN